MKTPEQLRADGWRKVHFPGVVRLVERNWQWEKLVVDGRAKLLLVSPRGRRWQFRLQRGAWLKAM